MCGRSGRMIRLDCHNGLVLGALKIIVGVGHRSLRYC